MEERPIIVSNEYRSGFLLRVKRTNGKVVSSWLEVSDHNEQLQTTLKSLGQVLSDMQLTGEVNLKHQQTQAQQQERGEVEQKLNVRYFCTKCTYNMPAFPSQPKMQSLWCPQCNKWGNFEKR